MPFNHFGAEETGELSVCNFWFVNLFSVSTFDWLELKDFATVAEPHIGEAIFLSFGTLQALDSRKKQRMGCFFIFT